MCLKNILVEILCKKGDFTSLFCIYVIDQITSVKIV